MTKNRYISIHHISKEEILEHQLRKTENEIGPISKGKVNLHSPSKKTRNNKKEKESKPLQINDKMRSSEGEIIYQNSEDNAIKKINYNNNIIIIQNRRNKKKEK